MAVRVLRDRRRDVVEHAEARGAEQASEAAAAWWVFSGVSACGAVILFLIAWYDSVNADEGFYLAAARHVADGRRLYADFFFPQMPYLPWLQAHLLPDPGSSLRAGRALSVVFGALGGGMIAALGYARRRRRAEGLFFGGLYVLNEVLMGALALNKTYGYANLCLLVALNASTGRSRRTVWPFIAGLAAGGAVGFRLATLPAVAVLAWLVGRRGTRTLSMFAIGCVLASLPWLWMAAASPSEFWFCNVTFHALRRELHGWESILAQKAWVVARWVFLPQNLVVWSLAAYAIRVAPRQAWPPAACALALALTYACATPTYVEYAAQFLPLLLLAALPAGDLLARFPVFAGGLFVIYLLIGVYPVVNAPIPGSVTETKRELWHQANLARVVESLKAHTGPRDPVLSWWEGYPALSGRPGFTGVGFWESNVAKKLDPELARRFHLMRAEEVEELIRRREPAAIVLVDGVWEAMRTEIGARYRAVDRVASVEIHLRRSDEGELK